MLTLLGVGLIFTQRTIARLALCDFLIAGSVKHHSDTPWRLTILRRLNELILPMITGMPQPTASSSSAAEAKPM
jgi:hypothetical protein